MVTKYGEGRGAMKWEGGGHVKVYPYKKVAQKKSRPC